MLILDAEDIYAFIGVLFLAGVIRRESILDHFSTNPILSSPIFDVMSRNQFQLITRYIYLHDNSKILNKSEKISFFINYLTSRWRMALIPIQKIVVDETMFVKTK